MSDLEKIFAEMLNNQFAIMLPDGSLEYIDPCIDGEMERFSLSFASRWGISTSVAGGRLSTVFLGAKAGGCFFESAFVSEAGSITVLGHHSTKEDAEKAHGELVTQHESQHRKWRTKEATSTSDSIFKTENIA